MQTQVHTVNGQKIATVFSEETLIRDAQSALDFAFSIKYETDSERIALNKGAIADEFFVLSSGLAGEVLQKFVTYQIKFAIYGDFSHYTSKPLRDFIYESNRGHHVFFVATAAQAEEKLASASF